MGACPRLGAGQIAVPMLSTSSICSAYPQKRGVQRGHRFLGKSSRLPRALKARIWVFAWGSFSIPSKINRPALTSSASFGANSPSRSSGDRISPTRFRPPDSGSRRAKLSRSIPAQHRIALAARQSHSSAREFQERLAYGKVFGLNFHLTPPAFFIRDQEYLGGIRPAGLIAEYHSTSINLRPEISPGFDWGN